MTASNQQSRAWFHKAPSGTEVGLREARRNLGELAASAYHADSVTYLTRHGRRVAAIVPARAARSVSQEEAGIEYWNHTAETIKNFVKTVTEEASQTKSLVAEMVGITKAIESAVPDATPEIPYLLQHLQDRALQVWHHTEVLESQLRGGLNTAPSNETSTPRT